jgi:hypothetical protein
MNAALLERAFVFIGRGASGFLPVVLTLIAARVAGLEATGRFSAVLALALALAELADISSQRHVTRTRGAGSGEQDAQAPRETLDGYFGLRWLLLVAGFPLACLAVPPGSWGTPSVATLAAAPLTLAVNTGYAVALRDRRDVWLAAGPLAAIVAALVVAGSVAAVAPERGEWVPVAALLGGRAVEALLLRRVITWPAIAFGARRVRAAWHETRYLVFQGGLSAAQARLVLPLTAWLAGSVAAGMLSIGLALVSILSLVTLASGLPAFRSIAGAPGELTPRRAWIALGPAFWQTLALVVVFSAGLVLAVPVLLTQVFEVSAPGLVPAVRLVVATGALEAVSIFAGLAYQAGFADRVLFRLSVLTSLQSWVGIGVGAALGGFVSLAGAYSVGRLAGVVSLLLPLVRERRAPVVGAET